MKHAIALTLALTLNAAANLMMKSGARRFAEVGPGPQQGLGHAVAALAGNWVLILGLLCFAVNAAFYIYALTADYMKVSLAYPIMVGGGFTIIALVAWKFMGETLTPGQWVGIALILLGVVIVAREMNPSTAA